MFASIPHLAILFGLFVFPTTLFAFPFVPVKRDTWIASATEANSPLGFADDLPKIFASFDANHDGYLSYEEFAHGVATKLKLPQNQTERFVNLPVLKEYFSEELDTDKDDQLSEDEFSAVSEKSRKFAEAIFNIMDQNNNGFVNFLEFADFVNCRLESEGQSNDMGTAFLLIIFSEIDTNGDGQLDLEEFVDKFSMSNTTAFTHSPLATSTATGVTKKDRSPFSKLIPAQLRIYLEQYDANGDGKWNFDEFVDMVDVVAAGSVHWKGNQARTERLRKSDLMRRIFNAMDTDGDGQLTIQEIMTIVDAAMSHDADALFSFSFKILDKNGDGGIEFEELMEFLKEWMLIADEWDEAKMEKMMPEMREKFNKVDKNGDGRIDMEELKEQYARKMAADSTNSLSPIVNSIKKRMAQLEKRK